MRGQTLWEGRWILVICCGALIVGWFFSLVLTVLAAVALLFTLSFFRDPERVVPTDPRGVVAPADGLITAVETDVELPQGGRGARISIFLSIFDVHVNRAPVAGKILASEEKPGLFLDARHADCAEKNAARTWTFAEQETGALFVVRQITGAIARRIVPWSKVGDEVPQGFRFGMIRFGSRTDLFLPSEFADVRVHVGEHVAGGVTVVARRKELHGG
jgi:phosphatidylserine decarboxylase